MPYKRSQIPRFAQIVKPLRERAFATTVELIKEFAGKEAQAFKDRILKQDFPAFKDEPLSDEWLAEKARRNLDLRTMLAAHNYIDHIKVYTQRISATQVEVYIGFDPNDMARDRNGAPTDFPLHLLAAVQEFGTADKRIPPRSHWGVQQQVIEARAEKFMRGLPEKVMHKLQRGT